MHVRPVGSKSKVRGPDFFNFKVKVPFFQNFKVKVKKKTSKERGCSVMLMLSLFGTFNTQEILGVYMGKINVI